MLLVVDSSGGTSVALLDEDGATLGEWRSDDARAHAEAIGPLLAQAITRAGGPTAITAVAYGTGPGPFTGLRVGMAAARAVAQALGVPTLPVVSHDAIAESADLAGRFVVSTDAKRRERYFTLYDRAPAALPERVGEPQVGPATDIPDVPIVDAPVSAAALGRVALARIQRGTPADDAQPRYLRSPDVTLAAPKRVAQ